MITDNADTIQRGTSKIKIYYEDMDPVIDMEQNENEGEGLLPTLGHLGQEMNRLEQEIDRLLRDNQNEVSTKHNERMANFLRVFRHGEMMMTESITMCTSDKNYCRLKIWTTL